MSGPPDSDRDDARSVREVLARRERALAALADGPLTQRDLRDAVDVSRSTAYKSLRELEAAGLVRATDDGEYQLTQYGSLARRRHDEYVAQVDRIAAAGPVLEELPDDLLLPLAFVERGETVTASRHAPERPFDRFETEAERSSEYRVLSPIAVPRYVGRLAGSVREEGLTVELLVETAAVPPLAEHESFGALLEEPTFDLLRTETSLPLGLLACDDRKSAAVFAYGPQGSLRGMLVSDAAEAYEWTDRTYRRYREDAVAVETP